MNILKNDFGQFIVQYCYEIFAFCFLFIFLVKFNLLYAIGVGCVSYVGLHLIRCAFCLFAKPKCEILHLSKFRKKNKIYEICMKPKFRKNICNKTDNDCKESVSIRDIYWNDFNKILEYAKFINCTTLCLKTHTYIASFFLDKIVNNNISREILKRASHEKVEQLSNIGKLEITYYGKYINSCARFQYSYIEGFKHFSKTLRKMKFYEIVIHIK